MEKGTERKGTHCGVSLGPGQLCHGWGLWAKADAGEKMGPALPPLPTASGAYAMSLYSYHPIYTQVCTH